MRLEHLLSGAKDSVAGQVSAMSGHTRYRSPCAAVEIMFIYRSTIYRSIDRDKQEKKEAESRRKVDKVELVL